MILKNLCLDYLDALILATSKNDSSVFLHEHQKKASLEFLLGDAIDIRAKIAEELECDVDRLIMITDNLDTAIDFMPSLERYESTRVYAQALERLLTSAACRIFLNGKAYRLTTPYGVIKETRPLIV